MTTLTIEPTGQMRVIIESDKTVVLPATTPSTPETAPFGVIDWDMSPAPVVLPWQLSPGAQLVDGVLSPTSTPDQWTHPTYGMTLNYAQVSIPLADLELPLTIELGMLSEGFGILALKPASVVEFDAAFSGNAQGLYILASLFAGHAAYQALADSQAQVIPPELLPADGTCRIMIAPEAAGYRVTVPGASISWFVGSVDTLTLSTAMQTQAPNPIPAAMTVRSLSIEATLPAGHHDGQLYRVIGAGSYANKSSLVGDYVQPYDDGAGLIIYRLPAEAADSLTMTQVSAAINESLTNYVTSSQFDASIEDSVSSQFDASLAPNGAIAQALVQDNIELTIAAWRRRPWACQWNVYPGERITSNGYHRGKFMLIQGGDYAESDGYFTRGSIVYVGADDTLIEMYPTRRTLDVFDTAGNSFIGMYELSDGYGWHCIDTALRVTSADCLNTEWGGSEFKAICVDGTPALSVARSIEVDYDGQIDNIALRPLANVTRELLIFSRATGSIMLFYGGYSGAPVYEYIYPQNKPRISGVGVTTTSPLQKALIQLSVDEYVRVRISQTLMTPGVPPVPMFEVIRFT